MKNNIKRQRLIKKYSYTNNIHEVSNDISISTFQTLYNQLIDEGYVPFDNDYSQGPWGCFCYKRNENEVTIYLLEIYSYLIPQRNRSKKDKSTMLKKTQNIVVTHIFKYNEKAHEFFLSKSSAKSVDGRKSWRDVQDEITLYCTDSNVIQLEAESLNDAIIEIESLENINLKKAQ